VVSEGLGGKYVDLYDFPGQPIEIRWKGLSLPYRVFSKNERLGHALALVKAQQDMKYQPQINQQREDRLPEKRGRKIYGPPTEKAAVEMTV
jgi:hypothetical protein